MPVCRNHTHKTSAVMLILSGSLCLAQPCFAGGFDNSDFSLRLPAALNRFSSCSDVAATGGASAANKWQSSVNPASTAWMPLAGTFQMSLNPQYSAILFDQGTVLNVVTESITKDFKNYGSLQLTALQVRSNERLDRQGTAFGYDMNHLQLQWGKRLSDDFAAGINLNYASTTVTNRIESAIQAKSVSDSYGIRAGLLYRAMPDLMVGLVTDYSVSPATTTISDISGSGGSDEVLRDRTKQFTIRTGPAYEYEKDSTLYFDYNFIFLENSTGNLGVHRFHAGVDHKIAEPLFLRGGLILDNHGNTSWTGGVGLYPSDKFGIDLGYQYNIFPEIQSEFGPAHLISIALSIIW